MNKKRRSSATNKSLYDFLNKECTLNYSASPLNLNELRDKSDVSHERGSVPFEEELLHISLKDIESSDKATVYCPVCQRSYPLTKDYFYFVRKKGYNEKYTMYAKCRACLKRYRSLITYMDGGGTT